MQFYKIAAKTADWAGSAPAFVGAVTVVLVWAMSGPIFGFSNTWQLFINTATTVTTFEMVFLIQNATNRTGLAIIAKLNEVIRAMPHADDRLLDIDHLSDTQIKEILARYRTRDGSTHL